MAVCDQVYETAVRLMAAGKATPAEIARLAGVSRQVALHWCHMNDIDWRSARAERLAQDWGR
jgi:hypothetical protein